MATIVVLTTACNDKEDNSPVTEVTLEKYKLTLVIGTTETLIAKVMPSTAADQTVSWSSNDPEIATVDAFTGEVTAEAVGIATITVKSNDGGKQAYCTVTVIETPVKVTGISLDKNTLSLLEGEKDALNVIFEPFDATNTNVIWSITGDNPEAISFDKNTGEVTAIAVGTAIIRVTAEEGDGIFYDECVVTVSENTISVTGVTLNKKSLRLKIGQIETLTATINPSNAANRNVIWTITGDNPEAISFNESTGEITAIAEGTATIKVTTVDGGFFDECVVTVEMPWGGITANLLEDADFEASADGTNTTVMLPWVNMSQADLAADGSGNGLGSNANLTNDAYWTTGAGAGFEHDGHTARFPTSNDGRAAGIYQLVSITPGKTYGFKIFALNFSPNNQPISPIIISIKNEDGSETLKKFETNYTTLGVWEDFSGIVTIPAGYSDTKVRFQICRPALPSGNIAGVLVDSCEFGEAIE